MLLLFAGGLGLRRLIRKPGKENPSGISNCFCFPIDLQFLFRYNEVSNYLQKERKDA